MEEGEIEGVKIDIHVKHIYTKWAHTHTHTLESQMSLLNLRERTTLCTDVLM